MFMVQENCKFMILVSYWSKRSFKRRFRTIIVEILESRERLLERQQGKGFWKGKSQDIDKDVFHDKKLVNEKETYSPNL